MKSVQPPHGASIINQGVCVSIMADLKGRVVEVPASIFGEQTGKVYPGVILGLDSYRTHCLEVKFPNYRDRYYFPIADIHKWLALEPSYQGEPTQTNCGDEGSTLQS